MRGGCVFIHRMAVLQLLQHDPQVQVGQPRITVSFGLDVVFHRERRVLLGELVQRGAKLLLLVAGRFHRRPNIGFREGERREVDVVLVVAVVQHGVEVQLVDLRDRGDVAGDRLRHLDMLLALPA